MKCEEPGYRAGNPIEIYEIGSLSAAMQKKIEDFRFPVCEFASFDEREKELVYDRIYINRSVYIVYNSPLDPATIVAVARIISKRSPEEKLPVEFASVISAVNNTKCVAGSSFKTEYFDERFPVCEIGGLRASGLDPEKGITVKLRYRAIDEVMRQCDKQVHDRRYKSFFLTCIGTPHMERLYHDKFLFDEVATISYNGTQNWKALWRMPFHNPVRKVEYAESRITMGLGFLWNTLAELPQMSNH